MKLDELRESIDIIDEKIADLFNERMRLCVDIAREKARVGEPVADKGREGQVLANVTARVDGDKVEYLKEVYEMIFTVSKKYQTAVAKEELE